MATQTGFASDHVDLMTKARTFILANGGTSLRYVTTAGAEEFIFSLPGSGTDTIISGMKCFTDTVADNFAWVLQGMIGFNNSLGFHEQPGAIQNYYPSLSLYKSTPADSNTIQYWFFVNSRRFMTIAKISNTYHQSYQGFVLPYGIPEQWPYPLLVGGSTIFQSNPLDANYNKPYRYSNTDWKTAAFWNNRTNDNNIGQACLREGGGVYRRFMHATNNSNASSACTGTWPYMEFIRDDYSGFTNMRPVMSGEYTLQPIIFSDGLTTNLYAELDGMKHVSGFSLAAEDTITVGADDWLAVPNVFRSGTDQMVVYKLV